MYRTNGRCVSILISRYHLRRMEIQIWSFARKQLYEAVISHNLLRGHGAVEVQFADFSLAICFYPAYFCESQFRIFFLKRALCSL